MSENTKIILALIAFGLFLVGSISWHFARSRAVLEQWAQEEGFEILRRDYRAFFRGPFFGRPQKGKPFTLSQCGTVEAVSAGVGSDVAAGFGDDDRQGRSKMEGLNITGCPQIEGSKGSPLGSLRSLRKEPLL